MYPLTKSRRIREVVRKSKKSTGELNFSVYQIKRTRHNNLNGMPFF